MSDSTACQEPVLLEETTDGARILTLNRAARKNALSADLVQAIIAGFEAAAADGDVRVVGLTGAGGLLAGLEDHLRDELSLARRALASEDGREAVRAIFEKRKPRFSGR